MAVQKSRVTRSRRDMRRSHDALTAACSSTDQLTGELHRRHHVAKDGYYRGQQVIFIEKEKNEKDEKKKEE